MIKKITLFSVSLLLISLIYFSTEPLKVSAAITKYSILIDLNDERLYLIDNINHEILKTFPVASGKSSTPSPIGTWTITNKGAWGKWFGSRWLGLNVPWGKYGLHGTNKPMSIGSAVSHGCIRMFNKDIEKLYTLVGVGTTVTIYGGPFGPFGNGFRIIKPGDSGADVYAVQKIMKSKGYYPYTPDGKYGELLKIYVIKFRKDNNLYINHNIDFEFCKVLGISIFE